MNTSHKTSGLLWNILAKHASRWSLCASILSAILLVGQEFQAQAGVILTPIIQNGAVVNNPYDLERQRLLYLYYNHPNRLLEQAKSRIVQAAQQRQRKYYYIWRRDPYGHYYADRVFVQVK
ncbi:MAG: hypothetical protein VYD34_01355 [Verrucomicrobiota bacterium]|jgi:hypothetical protein|nr:hypothetical protein [Verrucomicrobiota bacterium]